MVEDFLKLENELRIKLKIIPKSPLLIKMGDEKEASKSKAHAVWITETNNSGINVEDNKDKKKTDKRDGKIFIYGSTLKGMFRKRFYEMHKINNEDLSDEFGDKLEKDKTESSKIYIKSNKISKLFGSKVLKSRFVIQDGILEKTDFKLDDLETRSITPIDRFTGGAVVPLSLEYTREKFLTDLYIRNVSLEELKYIYFIIRDSINGEIRIGNSKTRGFGEIEFEIEKFEFKKYRGKCDEFKFLDKYFEIEEEKSEKIGDRYLFEFLSLKKEYKEADIEDPNEFIKSLFRGESDA